MIILYGKKTFQLIEQGVKVRLHVYEGMFHVFQMAMQHMPESRYAWKEIGKFLELLGESEI